MMLSNIFENFLWLFLTWFDDCINCYIRLVSHISENGEDDESSKYTSALAKYGQADGIAGKCIVLNKIKRIELP